MKTDITSEEVKKWAAKVRRSARRTPIFDRQATDTWEAVMGLAEAIRKSGSREPDRNVLIDLATDVLMIEVKAKGLTVQRRRRYLSNVQSCFLNQGFFWKKKPLLHIVGELSWIVDRAREESTEPDKLLDELIGSATVWGVPFRGHYCWGVSVKPFDRTED
jgi:hypothetical protein